MKRVLSEGVRQHNTMRKLSKPIESVNWLKIIIDIVISLTASQSREVHARVKCFT